MDTEEQTARIRTLRAKGLSPKDIARVLGVPPATAARLVRAIAAEQSTDPAQREVLHCWVNPGWSVGLTIHGRPDWVDPPQPETGAEGLVAVVVARDAGRSRVSVCGYLVDVYCLGVKDTIGPRVMNTDQAAQFTRRFYDAYQAAPVAAPLDLAQSLVHGAVEYARTLGFDPAPDFDAPGTTSGHGRGRAPSPSVATESPTSSTAHTTTPPASSAGCAAPSARTTSST